MGAAPYPANLFCGDMFSFCLIFMLFYLLFFRGTPRVLLLFSVLFFCILGGALAPVSKSPTTLSRKGGRKARLAHSFVCLLGSVGAQHSPMPANNYELCIMNYELFKRRCVRGSYGLSVKGSEPCTYHCHGYKEGRRCRKNFRSVKGAVHARNITYQ